MVAVEPLDRRARMNAVAVFVGGGLGSLARYGIGLVAGRWASGPLPWGTVLANLLATALLVAVTNWMAPQAAQLSRPQQAWLLLATTGFCGGFSTFSTFSLETLRLIEAGSVGLALANIAVSVGGCLIVGWSVWRVTSV